MAYTNFQNCTANEYKNIIYNQETQNKIKVLFNNVELEDADEYCESFEVVSRVIPNGSKIFMLENLVSQEATLVLHNIDTSIIQDQVSISIGTLVSENTYEYVPIGIYNLQEIPTTDNGKTTIKLRDNSVKLDFNYNSKPLIDEHGGTATKLQILQDICTKAGITCNVSSFIGSSDLIGIYDNTITGRQYVSYLAGSAGAIPIITRSGALDFKYLNNLSTIEIPIETVEQYSNAENFKISRVVYEDATRKYESGNETYDTLFLDSANPYISSQQQVASIYNIVNNFEINSFTTGRILGNPAIDSYDLIQITDYDGTIFKTFANNTLRYNGKMINTFASEISFERKKENVSLKSGATFKKWAKTEIDNANAQITIQAGQIDEIEQDIKNPTSIKENKYFDLEDALDSPLIDFSLYGQTQQSGTPSPDYPQEIHNVSGDNTIEICGKNLFDKTNTQWDRDNASTYAIGSGSTNTTRIRTSSFRIQGNKTYTISGIPSGISLVAVRTYEVPSGKSIGSASRNENTFTLNANVNYIHLLFGGSNFDSSTNTLMANANIQLEEGNQSTTYEAYTSNSQLISLGVENLFDKSNVNVLNAYITSGNAISSSNTAKTLYISCQPNTTYTISKIQSSRFAVAYSTDTPANNVTTRGVIQNNSATSMTITTDSNAKYLCVYYYHSSYDTTITEQQILDSIQIEKGSKANSYSPYGASYIELNKIEKQDHTIIAQDYFYPSNDKWYHHKEIGKVVFTGAESESCSTNAPSGQRQFYMSFSYGSRTGLCEYFKYNNTDATTNEFYFGSKLIVFVKPTVNGALINTLEDWKTWLGTNKPSIYYPLSTPTDTEITDTTLLEQLNNLMTLPLYKNMTHITLTPNDLQPTMKIEYYRDTSINENFVPKEDMTKYYTKTETDAQIQITSGSIMSEVSRVENKTDANNEYTSRVETSVTNLQTDTRTLLTFKQNVEQNGVETLKNTLIQADINGLSITKGESFNTQITDRTLEVNSNNKELIFLGYDNDLKKTVARMDWIESEHATIGVHRTETITKNGQKRTAGFYIGGGN